jgi:hypothetical protein
VSSLTLAEIVYLMEKRRIPAHTLENALAVLRDPEHEVVEVPFDSEVPDLPDRIVSATGYALRSSGDQIRASQIRTIW